MMRASIIIILSVFMCSVHGQVEELFEGENALAECRVDLPLTFKKKDKPIYEETAKKMKGVLLVRVQYNGKTGEVNYKKYYVVIDGEFVFLMSPESYEAKGGMKTAVFPEHKSKANRYYIADCFEEEIEDNEKLKAKVMLN